jgi:sterol desaturase/sphingolipid hydroxylase (fatty acid hydroxylase superfamily)
MMDLTQTPTTRKPYGSRDARGHWKPPYPAGYAPLFVWPPQVKALFSWLFGFPGFLWPFNIAVVLFAFLIMAYLQPPLTVTQTFEPGWIGLMLLRNLVIILVFYGGAHLAYYTLRLAGEEYKYNPSFQQETRRQYMFGKQTPDNAFRTLVFGLPIWTGYEVVYMWAAANGYVPYLGFRENPAGFIGMFFFILLFREVHFYFTHRLIHWGPLFKYVHSVHHMNPNPGPWSGLAMHPVEHLIYFSGVLIHFIIPSNPVHLIFHTQHLGIGPVIGHLGFESVKFMGKPVASDYFHYLHHKYVTCNFGMDMLPLDKWLGVYYDGEGEYRPKRRAVQKTGE